MASRPLGALGASALLAALAGACAGGTARAPVAGPAGRAARTDASALAANAACEGCHADVAAEWRESLHHASFDDASFQASYAREPSRFCSGCHVPHDPDAPPGAHTPLASLGIACTTCHGTEATLAATGEPRGAAPHAVKRDASFAGDAACARCHEFSFPDRSASTRDEDRMQRTLAEHARSSFASASCADCHMPRGPSGHRSHRFAASRDPDALRRALDARARVVEPGVVEVRLRAGQVGHAFPTGDLFRRLLVGVERVDEGGARVDGALAPMGRSFEFQGGHQRELEDRRPGGSAGAEVQVRLALAPSAGRLRYFVDYQRVQAAYGDDARVEATVRVAEGWVEEGR
jgi:hypothetical protein